MLSFVSRLTGSIDGKYANLCGLIDGDIVAINVNPVWEAVGCGQHLDPPNPRGIELDHSRVAHNHLRQGGDQWSAVMAAWTIPCDLVPYNCANVPPLGSPRVVLMISNNWLPRTHPRVIFEGGEVGRLVGAADVDSWCIKRSPGQLPIELIVTGGKVADRHASKCQWSCWRQRRGIERTQGDHH